METATSSSFSDIKLINNNQHAMQLHIQCRIGDACMKIIINNGFANMFQGAIFSETRSYRLYRPVYMRVSGYTWSWHMVVLQSAIVIELE